MNTPPARGAKPARTTLQVRRGDGLYVVDQFLSGPKQVEFFRAANDPRSKEILFDGSIRGGKSQACCKLIVAWAMRYGGTYGVFRSTKQELNDSTRKIMLEGDGRMPPSLPPEFLAKKNEEYNYVQLRNGAYILFRSLEPKERGKIRNITFAGGFIDQAEELDGDDDEDYYDELLGRLSDPMGPNKMLLAANPGPEDHWVCTRFGCTDEAERDRTDLQRRRRRRVHVDIYDNMHNLSDQYVLDLLDTEQTAPDYFRRMVLGLWGSFGGKRFKTWNRDRHVYQGGPFNLPDEWEILEGIDWGNVHPCVCLWVAIDHAGAWWVVAEHYKKEETVSWHSEEIKRIRKNQGAIPMGGSLEPSGTWLSHDAFNVTRKGINSIAVEFAEHGVYAARADNERIAGWNRIEEFLNYTMPDGLPRLRIMPWCVNLIRELPNLRYKAGTDDVEKKNDDTADALRYIFNSRMPTPLEKAPAQEDERTRASVMARIVERATNRDAPGRVVTDLGGLP